jgi:NADPH:quinone reductase-like Zn-dependent oxidoreductase
MSLPRGASNVQSRFFCSGIGTTAIQLCKAKGARVIVTVCPLIFSAAATHLAPQVGSDSKRQACLDCGADLVVNYKSVSASCALALSLVMLALQDV